MPHNGQLAVLLNQHILRIPQEIWSEELKSQFTRTLIEHQINDLVVYRERETGDYLLCIKGFVPENIELEKNYQKRPNVIKAAPVLALVCVIFAVTALMARDLRMMMSAEFLIFMPFFIGALAQYFYSYQQENSVGKMFSQQAVILGVLILASLFLLREGIICVIMASPFLYLWQICGAVLMRILCKSFWTPTTKIYSLSIVPLLILWADPFAVNTTFSTTKNELIIQAPASEVFHALNDIQKIQDHEIKDSPIFWMGFPKPISGMTVQDSDGLTRKIHWQRGIYFEEKITHSTPSELLAWTYRFTPESFPKGSLDDHVEIGGEYFDLASTDYRLEKISPTETKLILTIDYRLSTEMNWYSKLWADYVLNEFSDVVLNIYKERLEVDL